jgi:hypothetical protein
MRNTKKKINLGGFMSEDMTNEKAKKFYNFLTENKIGYFKSEIYNDEVHTVVFRTELPVQGQQLPLLLLTDDSIYTMIKINALNLQFKIFKYALTAEGDIVIDISLPSVAEKFDERLVMSAIDIAYKHLEVTYPEFMQLVWATQQ